MKQKKFLIIISIVLSVLMIGEYSNFVIGNLDVATDFTLTDIDDVTFSLSNYRGKVVLLDFFFIACQPCKQVIPYLRSFYNLYSDKITIISITVSPVTDTDSELDIFRNDQDMLWTIAKDMSGVSSQYGVSAAPTLVIIDADGYIRYRHVGSQNMEEVAALLDGLEESDSTSPAISVTVSPRNPETTQTVAYTITVHDDMTGSGVASIDLYIGSVLEKSWTNVGTHIYTAGPYSQGTQEYYLIAEDKSGNIRREPNAGTLNFEVSSPLPPSASEDQTWIWTLLFIGGFIIVAILVTKKIME